MKKLFKYLLASSMLISTGIASTFVNTKTVADETKLYTVDPVAHYEFNDADNLGKDSAGSYDLITYGTGLTNGTDDNGSYLNFASASMLYASKENNFPTGLTNCTFTFKLKKSVNPGEWNPIFATGNGYTEGVTVFGANGFFDAKIKSNDNIFNAPTVDGTDWNTVLVTIDTKNGTMNIYVDGTQISPNADVVGAENLKLGCDDFAFAIGGRWNLWSNTIIENTSSFGSIRDFRVYNVSVDQVEAENFFNSDKVEVANRPVDWQSPFSNEQGKNGYFYCYGLPTAYKFLEWGFINGTTEQAWRVGHDDWYQQITKSSMHPGCFRWSTIKAWVADRDGVISLEGDIAKLVTSPTAMGNGIDTSIWMNGKELCSHHFTKDEATPFDVKYQDMEVKKGDTILFVLHAGENYQSSNDYAAFRLGIFWESQGDNYVEGEDLSKYLSVVETEAEMIGVIDVQSKTGDFDKE